ncbi:MAG: class I SAM-dependent methyltransferase [Gammaproteobacteria bacterium]|jgi:SAM-dependent methyltransferase|nr:class I SAM-dependent methyltransferase [Gammaproteobacteria bacterium]MDP6615784.1 class I SAM-dependent methyltransferase [Gammaproteobacteria bacterium]MDP6695530.1 class I SAM-dependent methyltransferase [Gammaproteobacteria bacterium]
MAARSEEILSEETKAGATMAERADIHELYEESVQNVEEECNFVRNTFKSLRGRDALSFREDFCGTASAACYWTGFSPEHSAIGVDIDQDVLEWGRQNRVGRLNPDRQTRVRLMQSDVMDVQTEPMDTIGAFNFSYWIFQTRPLMIEYFSKIHAALKPDGVIFLDAFGGYEAFEEMKEKTKYDNFTYVWDQDSYSPVTGEMVCHIHFKFPDKSKIKRAFSYTWRLWTLPELKELLLESGFKNPTVYWEGTDEDGEGDGVFTPDERGEADAGWIAYIVAEK